MYYNIAAYILYLIIIVMIIYRLGAKLHAIGRVFILDLYKNDGKACDAMNNILLVAYYLFNTGYALLKLHRWQYIHDFGGLLSSLGRNIGLLLIILSVAHYFNMTLVYRLSKSRKTIF